MKICQYIGMNARPTIEIEPYMLTNRKGPKEGDQFQSNMQNF